MSIKEGTESVSLNWETSTTIQEFLFTTDQVLDAYIQGALIGKAQGKKEALEETQRLQYEKLLDNVNSATAIVDGVLEFSKKLNIVPSAEYLKLISWNKLNILITVSESDFLKPELLRIYDFIQGLKNRISDLLKLEIIIAPISDDFDEDSIFSEGYQFKGIE